MHSSSDGPRRPTSSERTSRSPRTEVIAVIHACITTQLAKGSGHEVAADTPLIQNGYLTSLEAVELVMFLGEKFGIEIDPEEVNEHNFRSISSIATLVEQKLEAE